MRRFFLLSTLSFFVYSAMGQHGNNPLPYFSYNKGLGIATPDSAFALTIRFRMQNRLAMSTLSDKDLSTKEWEMIVRRLRLRLDGFVYSPRITYALQLSFSRGDMDWENTSFPNVIRDAMIFYRPGKHFTMGVGQTKLPGNRQRIVSSGDLQFCDRSEVNAKLNIDRDFGAQFYYDNQIGNLKYLLRAAVSQGEGRNVANSNEGLMYSTRVELFPFGSFTAGGDYYEADLMRENKPKLAIAGIYAFDDKTTKSGGTLGKALYGLRSFTNYGGDFLFKYRGLSLSSELIIRESSNPVTKDSKDTTGKTIQYIYSGMGLNAELSYVTPKNYLVGFRFSQLNPDSKIAAYERQTRYYTMVVGRFMKGHRLKVQSDVTYVDNVSNPSKNNFIFRFQVELGI